MVKWWEKLIEPRFVISVLLTVPAWVTIWKYNSSQPLLILGSNVITGVLGYWIGSSQGSQEKNQIMADTINKEGAK